MRVDRVSAVVWVDVDPATAFAVFTDEIGAWFDVSRDLGTGASPPRGVLRFEPGEGGRLLEVYDEAAGRSFEVGRVRVWQPSRRLVFEWRQGNFAPDQSTEVEVRFERDSGGTRVTLEHRGFASLPLDHGARHGLGDGAAFARLWTSVWEGLLARFQAAVPARPPVAPDA